MGRTINTILNLRDNFSPTLRRASENTNQFRVQLRQANDASNKITSTFGTLAKKALSVGTAIAGAAGVSGGLVTKNFMDYDSALRQAAASTGATTTQIAELGETIKSVYGNNFGESWEDVANSVAEVTKNIGGTSDEIKKATENALALRDTFGYEIQESTRTVDMMMKQFGITGNEAFNLIAQGSQMGLDKNGNFLDSLNEYSVHFKQLGLGAEQMFNIFSAGASKGIFDIDKMGDAFKEFGIRGKDGSDSTTEAFKTLGLNATEMQNAFAKGGESASSAFQKTLEALKNLESPIERNLAGVNLFGTMWEDLGEDAILAALDVNNAFNKTADTMGEINQIKYSSFTEVIKGIGRQLEVAALPIGEKLMPYLNDFANFLNNKLPPAVEKFTGFLDNNLDTAINNAKNVIDGLKTAFEFLKNNMGTILPIVSGIAGALGAFVIVTKVVTLFDKLRNATALLNVTLLANPITWVAIGIGLLIAAFVLAYKNSETFRNKVNELWNTLKPIATFIGTVFSVVFANAFSTITAQAMNFISMISGILEGLITILNGIITFVIGVFTGNWQMAWQGVSDIFNGIFIQIESIAKGIVNGIINTINGIIGGINGLASKASEVPGLGWAAGINIPLIPTFAKGTNWFGGGVALVGEEGPELVNLPSGSSVKTASQTKNILNQPNQNVQITVHVHGNFYSNDKAADELGEKIVNKFITALGNT